MLENSGPSLMSGMASALSRSGLASSEPCSTRYKLLCTANRCDVDFTGANRVRSTFNTMAPSSNDRMAAPGAVSSCSVRLPSTSGNAGMGSSDRRPAVTRRLTSLSDTHMLLVLKVWKRFAIFLNSACRGLGTCIASSSIGRSSYCSNTPPCVSERVRLVTSRQKLMSSLMRWYMMERSTVAPRLSTLEMKRYSLPCASSWSSRPLSASDWNRSPAPGGYQYLWLAVSSGSKGAVGSSVCESQSMRGMADCSKQCRLRWCRAYLRTIFSVSACV
mmetsp:Transcript_19575/g.69291  ORF Transcript_19575/g.69291 Transcript_19575/m.69291 type:complete len:274 (-) Transcript_19575:494-1315(-)